MLGLTRWCISNRRKVILGWVAFAVLATVVATAVGRNYAQNFTLPGTESQRAVNLLTSEFQSQSGDLDTIVWHTSSGTVDAPAVRRAIQPLLARVEHMPHVVAVTSPYGPAGAFEISRDRKTASRRCSWRPRATAKSHPMPGFSPW